MQSCRPLSELVTGREVPRRRLPRCLPSRAITTRTRPQEIHRIVCRPGAPRRRRELGGLAGELTSSCTGYCEAEPHTGHPRFGWRPDVKDGAGRRAWLLLV